jgi:hypothetical protein
MYAESGVPCDKMARQLGQFVGAAGLLRVRIELIGVRYGSVASASSIEVPPVQ